MSGTITDCINPLGFIQTTDYDNCEVMMTKLILHSKQGMFP